MKHFFLLRSVGITLICVTDSATYGVPIIYSTYLLYLPATSHRRQTASPPRCDGPVSGRHFLCRNQGALFYRSILRPAITFPGSLDDTYETLSIKISTCLKLLPLTGTIVGFSKESFLCRLMYLRFAVANVAAA